ncbi:unnamed protein product, partial [Symbiodinium necroappetens]
MAKAGGDLDVTQLMTAREVMDHVLACAAVHLSWLEALPQAYLFNVEDGAHTDANAIDELLATQIPLEVENQEVEVGLLPVALDGAGPQNALESALARFPVVTSEEREAKAYKVVLCHYFESGWCRNGDRCTYAHGPEELRLPSKAEARLQVFGRRKNGRDASSSKCRCRRLCRAFSSHAQLAPQADPLKRPQVRRYWRTDSFLPSLAAISCMLALQTDQHAMAWTSSPLGSGEECRHLRPLPGRGWDLGTADARDAACSTCRGSLRLLPIAEFAECRAVPQSFCFVLRIVDGRRLIFRFFCGRQPRIQPVLRRLCSLRRRKAAGGKHRQPSEQRRPRYLGHGGKCGQLSAEGERQLLAMYGVSATTRSRKLEAMIHPPAMGGKTAWGVNKETVHHGTDDPEELRKLREAQGSFNSREEERLQRLKAMDRDADSILEARRARKSSFDPMAVQKRGDVDAFRKQQEEALLRMAEMKEQKRLEKKQKKLAEKGEKPKKEKKVKKKKGKKDKKKKDKKKKKEKKK